MQETVLSIQAIVDFLNRRNPGELARLQASHPDEARLLRPGKQLGGEPSGAENLLKDLAHATLADARAEGTALARRLRDKARLSSRLRFTSAVISALSAGTLIAAVAQNSKVVALVNGCITFVASAISLGGQYVEDYMGGQKSLRELRETIAARVLEVAEVDAEFRLMTARNDFSGVEALIRRLNVALASFRVVELTLE